MQCEWYDEVDRDLRILKFTIPHKLLADAPRAPSDADSLALMRAVQSLILHALGYNEWEIVDAEIVDDNPLVISSPPRQLAAGDAT